MVTADNKTVYLVDTNVLIGFSLWKPISLELNKKFWEELSNTLKMGRWVLLDVIYREVKFDRDLLKWCKEQNKKGLVTNIDDGIRNQAININNNYEMIDPLTFKSEADTFLLAFAKINGLGIFSRESKRTKERDLYKIPDVCDIFKIRHTSKPKVFLKEIGFN